MMNIAHRGQRAVRSPRREAPRKSGFTLVETLVAIAILAIAVSGPLYSASRSIIAAQLANERLTASYLAQEGIEYVRAMRDHEYLSAFGGANATLTAWDNFLNGGASFKGSVAQCRAQTCVLDPVLSPMGVGSGKALATCSGDCAILRVRSTGADAGVYTTSVANSTPTPYTRTVEVVAVAGAPVDANGNPVNVRVVSLVSWIDRGVPYSITVTDLLTPWQ